MNDVTIYHPQCCFLKLMKEFLVIYPPLTSVLNTTVGFQQKNAEEEPILVEGDQTTAY